MGRVIPFFDTTKLKDRAGLLGSLHEQLSEAKVHANSVNLRFTDSGYTVHYKVYRFTTKSAVRWEARIFPTDNTSAPQHITFTKFRPLGQEKEETAVEWPDPRVDKLVMVQKYTDIPEDMPVILVLAAILFF